MVQDLHDPLSNSLQKLTSRTLTSKKAHNPGLVLGANSSHSARRILNSNPRAHCRWPGGLSSSGTANLCVSGILHRRRVPKGGTNARPGLLTFQWVWSQMLGLIRFVGMFTLVLLTAQAHAAAGARARGHHPSDSKRNGVYWIK